MSILLHAMHRKGSSGITSTKNTAMSLLERVVSGPGIEHLYWFLVERGKHKKVNRRRNSQASD